ncbi:hypothetical protein HK096_004772, partial [Nowakowskiella sp. JEL0078]
MDSHEESNQPAVPIETTNPITTTPVRKRGRPRKSDVSKVSEGLLSSSAEESGENADDEGVQAENGSPKSKRARQTLAQTTPDREPRETRIRKPVERLAESPLESKSAKPLEIPAGKGITLAEFPEIVENLAKRTNEDATLKGLHVLIWGKTQKDEEKFRSKIERWEFSELKELCEFLCLNETGHKQIIIENKESLVERVFDFLLEPRPEESPDGKRVTSGNDKRPSSTGRRSKRFAKEHANLTAFDLFVADQVKLTKIDNGIVNVVLQTLDEISINSVENSTNFEQVPIAPAEAPNPVQPDIDSAPTAEIKSDKTYKTSNEGTEEEKMKNLWNNLPEDEKLKYINLEAELLAKEENVPSTEDDYSLADNAEENGKESVQLPTTPRGRGRPRGTSKTPKPAKPLTPATPGSTGKKRGRPLSEKSKAAAALAQEEANEINNSDENPASKGSIPDDKDLIADISEILR